MRSLRDRLKGYKKEIIREDEVAATLDELIDEVETQSELPETALEAALPGWEEETPYGRCYLREVRFDALTSHGHYPLARTRHLEPDLLHKVCKAKGTATLDWAEICFFDTETTGLGTGAGSFIFLFGIGYFEEDEFVVRQYFLRQYGEERAMLWAISQLLERFQAAVSFNGKGFDWKLLETRFTMQRLELQPTQHLDLLPPARRLYKKVLGNTKLITLETEVLGFSRVDDTPGKMAPELYFAYQTDGDARRLAGIFTHNVHDILTLTTLSAHIGGLVAQPLVRAEHPEELFGLSRWYDEWTQREFAEACLVRVSEIDEAGDYAREALWKLSLLHKRLGQYEKAALLWEELLTEPGMWQTAPRIELAKYYEHRVRDIGRALTLTEQTITLVQERRMVLRSLAVEHELRELEHRRSRLVRKSEQAARG